ncbi:hypothetical protein D3C71_2073180 [compost metagenome]
MLKPMVPLTIPATSGPDITASARKAKVITANSTFMTPSIIAYMLRPTSIHTASTTAMEHSSG